MASVFLGQGGVPEALLEAARMMAFRDGVDPETMERLLRRVGRAAQFRVFNGFLEGPANDEGSG